MMNFAIDFRDTASPLMASLMARNRRITSEALRDTAFQHRIKLKEYMKGHGELKKLLDDASLARLRAKHTNPAKEASKAMQRNKHDHATRLPYRSKVAGKPPLWNALRFTSADVLNRDYPLAYHFGFIDTRTAKSAFIGNQIPSQVKGAARYALTLAQGGYFDKKTGQVLKLITPAMRKYFGFMGIGIPKKKKVLKYPKRNPVADYIKSHKAEIIFDFRRNFAKRLRRHLDREAERAKASSRVTTYSTNARATATTFADRYYQTGRLYYS